MKYILWAFIVLYIKRVFCIVEKSWSQVRLGLGVSQRGLEYLLPGVLIAYGRVNICFLERCGYSLPIDVWMLVT